MTTTNAKQSQQAAIRAQLVAKGLVRPDPLAFVPESFRGKPATPVVRHNDLTRPVFAKKP